MSIRRFLDRWFGKSEKDAQAQRLADALLTHARDPWFYVEAGMPDTLDGRYSVVVLHLWMLSKTLRRRGSWGVALAQDTFDATLDQIERGLREAGVGDIAIPKRLAKLTRIFHGHAKAFDAALETAEPAREIGETVKRNLTDSAGLDAKRIGEWTLSAWGSIDAAADDRFARADLPWSVGAKEPAS